MVVFVVGSPRSGTTLLGNILDRHPSIKQWYEPHFVIDRFHKDSEDDCREAGDVTPGIASFIYREFTRYSERMNKPIIADKSPMNSLKIPFLQEVFPEAKFIHIVRDGRDATLSINKEWSRRSKIIHEATVAKRISQGLKTMTAFMNRQDGLRYKLRALLFELQPQDLFDKGPRGLFWRAGRWPGQAGWGPQFRRWQEYYEKLTTLQFNAMQWHACVQSVCDNYINIASKCLQIYYESLLDEPEETLHWIFNFLNVDFPNDFMARIPPLNRGNYGKWNEAFSPEAKAQIGPILHPLLEELGYSDSPDWYDAN